MTNDRKSRHASKKETQRMNHITTTGMSVCLSKVTHVSVSHDNCCVKGCLSLFSNVVSLKWFGFSSHPSLLLPSFARVKYDFSRPS